MGYRIVFHPEAQGDIDALEGRLRTLVGKKLLQIAQNPAIGKPLGNVAGTALAGYLKTSVDDRRVRIVYCTDGGKLIVTVVAVGKREDMLVYKIAASRL